MSTTFIREPSMKRVKLYHTPPQTSESQTSSIQQQSLTQQAQQKSELEKNDFSKYNFWRIDSINNPVWHIDNTAQILTKPNNNNNNNSSSSPSSPSTYLTHAQVVGPTTASTTTTTTTQLLRSNRFSFHSSLSQIQQNSSSSSLSSLDEQNEEKNDEKNDEKNFSSPQPKQHEEQAQREEETAEEQEEDRRRRLAGDEIYHIFITEKEQAIFNFLLEVNEHFGMNSVLRVAGGWVRNKLLHMNGDDIDVALDNCMGIQFAEKVLAYEKLKDMPDQYRSIGVICANPEQSKHLETATTHIFGESIDFVNLRCEEYAVESDNRIPQVIRVGTALEDAYRRDLTINSMFYNINESKIEDFTGRGIDDLKRGIVRTPLPPLQTFLDDPLRVLRAVRFAAYFNFVVADELIAAARDARVARALGEKVSRERVGIELAKMLQGSDPVGAFALLREMKIDHVVFALSGGSSNSGGSGGAQQRTRKQVRVFEQPVPIVWKQRPQSKSVSLLNHDDGDDDVMMTEDEIDDYQWNNALFRMRFVYRCALENELSTDLRAKLVLAAFISDIVPRDCLPDMSSLSDATQQQQQPAQYDESWFHISDKLELWVENLVCTSLRQPQHFAKDVCTIVHGAHVLASLMSHYRQQQRSGRDAMDENIAQRYVKHVNDNLFVVSKWLRTVKHLYPCACHLATVYYTKGTEFEENGNIFFEAYNAANDDDELQKRKKVSHGEEMIRAIRTVCHGRLEQAIDMGYVLNGREVLTLVQVKPGMILTLINRELMDWQLQHLPHLLLMTEQERKQVATEWLQSQAARFQQLALSVDSKKGSKAK